MTAVFLSLILACGGNEGDPCDVDADCADGLICHDHEGEGVCEGDDEHDEHDDEDEHDEEE